MLPRPDPLEYTLDAPKGSTDRLGALRFVMTAGRSERAAHRDRPGHGHG
jgi:hypothetical protein